MTLEKRVIPGSIAGGGTTVTVNIAFDADPSIDTKDEIRYYYGEDDENAATLKEALKDIWWAGAEPYGPWELYSLNGLAVLGDEVFVADCGNGRVRKFTSMGAFRAATPPGTFDQPYGLCVAGGYLYLAEATTPPDTGAIVKLDRDSLAEVARYTDDLLCQPLGVAVDAAGNIYTVHVNVPGILKRDAATGAWSTWKEGIAGFSVAVSGDGHIYVIEQGVNEYVIRKFSLADGSGGAWETSVPIVQPDGLAVDSANRVYVCDADSRKILRFAADGTLLGQFDSPALFNGAWQHPVAVSDGSVICTASDVAGQVVAIRNMLTFVSDENNRFDGADVEVNITKIDGQSVEGMTVFDVSTWTTIDATVAYWRSGVMQMSYSKQFSKVEGETGLFQAMWSVSGGVQEDDPQIQWIAGSVHSGGAKPRVAYIPATARATAVLDLSTFSLAIGSVDYDLEQDGMYAYPQGGSFAFVVVVPDKDVPSARAKSICYDKAGNIVHKEDIVFPDGLFGNIASKAQDIAFEAHRDAAIVRHNWVLITHDPRFEAVAQESAGKLKQAELMSNKATLSFPCTEQEAEYYTATLAGEGDDCPGHKVWSDNLITFEFRTDEDDGNGGRTGKAKTDPSGNVYIEGVIFHSLYTRFPYDIKVFKNDRPFFTVPITVAPLLRFTGSYAQGPGFYPDILKAGVTFDPCSDRFLREGSLTFTIPGLRMAYATVPGFEPFGDEQIPDTTSTYDRAVFTLQNDPDPNLPISEQGDMTGVHYLHCLHSPGGSYDIRSNLNVVEAKWEGFNDLLDAQRPVDGEEEGTIFLGSKEAEFESNWGQPPQTMQGYSPTFLVGEGSYLLKVGAKLFVDESQVHRYEIKIKVRYRKD